MGRTQERNLSWWLTSEPPRPRPSLDGDLAVEVVVIGGGLTGLATARRLHDDGASVAVLEADRIASGTTGYTTAKVTSLHGLPYADMIRRHGDVKARQYVAANQWAVEEIATLVDAERLPALTYTTDPDCVADMRDEVEAARSLGLPATFVTDTDLPFEIQAAVQVDDQAQVHPRRLANLLAEPLTIYEQTRALELDEDDDGVRVATTSYTVRAKHAVIATLLPFDDAGGYFAKTSPMRSYAMAVRVRGDAPGGMYISIDSPTRSLRPLSFDDGAAGVVVGGNGHRVGEEPDTEGQYLDLERWARALFDVTAVEARWSAQDYVPVDRTPYIGRSPRRDHTFVATGFQKWGMTTAFVAASIIADGIAGRESEWAPVFDSTRVDPVGSARAFVKTNAHVVKPFIAGRLARREKVCTHLGCVVRWNDAEQSWDCPCHGSRFTADGDVLEGPATEPLAPVSVEIAEER